MINLDNVPEYLREHGRFCLWKYEERDGRKTKVPYNPMDPGRRASSTDPKTFCSWSDLLMLWLKVSDRFDGVGVGVFDDISAFDIDHCFDENGNPSQMALYIVKRMRCYTEKSPSGQGIRIFFRREPGLQYDKQKYYINNRSAGLEIYIAGMTNKFLTVTGDAIRKAPAEIRGHEVLEIVERYMKRPEAVRVPDPEPLELSDSELISKAALASNGDLFRRLWTGDISGYNSQSDADQALCNILAFWTGRDADRMDQLFRSSGLMRDKWKRADYRAATINNAIRGCREIYTGPERASAAEDFRQDPEEEEVKRRLPEPEIFTAEILQHLPELRPSIIEGLLRAGHKMMIAGPSKAGKSFSMIELALAFAAGTEWLGFQCKQCRVLYCNLEVDGDSFKHRIAAIMEKLEISPDAIGDRLKLWNLRGKAAELSTMLTAFKEQARGCDVLILDPIYKIMEGDENSASEMGKFTRNLDKLAEEGAAIIYAHHFGKATQNYVDAMSRASGSGVFARDPDTIITMSSLDMTQITPDMKSAAEVSSNASAFQLDFTLREFPPVKPFKIWFDYPVHVQDDGTLDAVNINGHKPTQEEKDINREAKAIAALSKVFDQYRDQIESDGGISLKFLNDRVDSIEGRSKKVKEKQIRNYTQYSRDLFYVQNGKLYQAQMIPRPDENPFINEGKYREIS